MQFLARELGVDDSEILSYDLNLYNYDEPQLVGLSEELVVSPRLDNLASVSALLESLVEGRGWKLYPFRCGFGTAWRCAARYLPHAGM